MKLQINDIFAAFKDSRRQLSRFKTGVLFNDSNELVKNKRRSHEYRLDSTAGFGPPLTLLDLGSIVVRLPGRTSIGCLI